MSITAQPSMAVTAPPQARFDVHLDVQPDVHPNVHPDRRLRLAGIAVLAAAALGSVLGAAPAVSDTPSTDQSCRMDIVGSYWFSSGCTDEPTAPGAR